MWNSVNTPVGFLQVINHNIARLHAEDADYLPDLSAGSALIVGSDYSGDHAESRYAVITFVLTSSDQWMRWERARQKVRSVFRLQRRRMSYTKLRDSVKNRALRDFLNSIGTIDGLLCSVIVNKNVTSLFDETGRIDLQAWELGQWSHWNSSALEKMFRVVHTVAFFSAGLASAGQNLFWITDEDAIAPNPERLDEVTANFAHVIDRYLTRKLAHIRCSTTAGDTGILDMEDLVAIPDLAGGALADLFTAYLRRGVRLSQNLVLPQPDDLCAKARQIFTWLQTENLKLKRLYYLIEREEGSQRIEVTDVNLSGRPLIYAPPRLGA